jgi:hypothetical protein
MNRSLLASAIAFLSPIGLDAQQMATASNGRCDRAISVAERADFRTEAARDLAAVRYCGERGGVAVARLLRQTSRSSRAADLTRSVDVALGFQDASIFTSALEIAGDRSTPIPGRAQALRILLSMLGGVRVTYSSLTTKGPMCEVYVVTDGPGPRAVGRQLPADFSSRIKAAAERVRDEPRKAPELTSAAECVLVAVKGFSTSAPRRGAR